MNEPPAFADQQADDLAEVILMELSRRIPGTLCDRWELATCTGEFTTAGFDGPYPLLERVIVILTTEKLAEEINGRIEATTLGRRAADELITPTWRPAHANPDSNHDTPASIPAIPKPQRKRKSRPPGTPRSDPR